MAVLLEAIASQGFPSARILLIDPHGEYESAVGQYGRVFKVNADTTKGELPLVVPFWALPFEELQAIALGAMQPATEAIIRDEVTARKKTSVKALCSKPAESAITSDSPIPFSLKGLWLALDDYERQTYSDNAKTISCAKLSKGDADLLLSSSYPAPSIGANPPYAAKPRGITKQLELLKSRLQDPRYSFLFSPGDTLSPDLGWGNSWGPTRSGSIMGRS
jgi:hypothetical protein